MFFNKSIVTLCYRRMIKGSCHTWNQEEDGRFLDHCDHTGRIQEVSDGSLDRKKTEMTTEQTSSTSWLWQIIGASNFYRITWNLKGNPPYNERKDWTDNPSKIMPKKRIPSSTWWSTFSLLRTQPWRLTNQSNQWPRGYRGQCQNVKGITVHWKGVHGPEYDDSLSEKVWKWVADPCINCQELIEIHGANPNNF